MNTRNEALAMVEEGLVSAEAMLAMCLGYMSQDDVADMLDANELSERFNDEDEEPDFPLSMEYDEDEGFLIEEF